MSSVEKKQAVQNAIFGTIAGLVMGGPSGAIIAGAVGAGLAHLEEQKDEELRRKERERRNQDPVRIIEQNRQREKEIKDRLYKQAEVREMIKSKQPIVMDGRFRIEYDPYRNKNVPGVTSISPEYRPYGIIYIYERRLWYAYHDEPMLVANGTFYNIHGYYDKLSHDINNPNIRTYTFINDDKFNNGNQGRKQLFSMYTIDDEKSFNVLMNG